MVRCRRADRPGPGRPTGGTSKRRALTAAALSLLYAPLLFEHQLTAGAVMTYIIGDLPGAVVHVTGPDGTTSVPGVPITEITPPEAALLPAQVASDDSFPALALVATVVLSPALVTDTDAFHRPIAGPLAPSRITDLDSIFTPAVTRAKLPKEQRLRPDRIEAIDTFFAFTKSTGPVSVLPALVASDDVVAAADVGWHLFVDAPVADVDEVYSDIHIELINYILPETYADEESTETYPFKVQAVSGGISVPAKPHLTGSLSQRRVLTGSLSRPIHLTGSMKRKGRVLTGSVRGVHYGNTRKKR